MKTAVRIGCSPLEFWELTPYEFFLKVEAYGIERERDREDKITQAWLNARWTIQWLGKKSQHPPSLNELLNKKSKTMSSDDMLNEVKRLNAMFGGKIKYETPTERSET